MPESARRPAAEGASRPHGAARRPVRKAPRGPEVPYVLTREAAATVGVARGPLSYDSARSPFSSCAVYPEQPDPEMASAVGDRRPNEVFAAVREALRLLGLDAARFGTTGWNPLGELIRPGDRVVLKPNFVRDFRESSASDGDCLITHGAVLRAVIDYAYLALGGEGRIVVADAPQNDAAFDQIRRITAIDDIRAYYAQTYGFDIEVYDLRPERAVKVDGVIVGHERLPGDPAGYVRVDLGDRSAFAEVEQRCHQLYGAEYDASEVRRHHTRGKHEYLISRTVLEADCVICLPKLKTHKKTGITVNLKNLVGINGNKNWLPHHREGTPSQGGDQFAEDTFKRRFEQATVARFKRIFPKLGFARAAVAAPLKWLGKRVFGDTNNGTVRSGNWFGNDTTWRMVLDLNRALVYADSAGELHDRPVRRFLSVVDGIVAGEGNGPLDPTPKAAGLVLAGRNPVAVDLACARYMGFDYRKIPMLARALEPHPLPLVPFAFDEVTARTGPDLPGGPLAGLEGPLLAFEAHFGWKGHVEVEP